MAAKKNKPALYELIKKGSLKPTLKGKFSTPSWFYKSKSQQDTPVVPSPSTAAKPMEKPSTAAKPPETLSTMAAPKPQPTQTIQPAQITHPPQTTDRVTAIPAALTPPTVAPMQTAAIPSAGVHTPKPSMFSAETHTPKSFSPPSVAPFPTPVKADAVSILPRLRFGTAKVHFTASYWLIGLAILALLLITLGSYRLGQKNILNRLTDNPTFTDAPPSSQLDQIKQSPVRPDLITRPESPAAKADTASSGSTPTGTPAPTTTVSPSLSPPVSAAENPLRLILVTHTNERDIRPVQAYFNSKGVPTEIGRFGERQYVLYTRQGFASQQSAESSQMKSTITRLGGGYNDEKPKSAPRFNPESFSQSYFVNINKINPLGN